MGTNYYLHENTCPECGRGDEPLHIGKSSAGWCFGLHVYPDDPVAIKDLDDWRVKWSAPGCSIKNECGQRVTPEEMDCWITQRSFDGTPWSKAELRMNDAVAGPNNLARHKIDRLCIGHGKGTWDLLAGDFS